MNIVVTGATSFIGVPMIRQLLELNHQVFAVVRPHSKKMGRLDRKNRNLHIIPLELDRLDYIKEFINVECPVYFHFGWEGAGSDNRTNGEVQQKNVLDSIKALTGARTLGCQRFVFSGSQAEYGICDHVMTEETPCAPISEYGKAKVAFGHKARELVCRWNLEDHGTMEYIHTRLFSIYGPGDHPWSLIESCLNTFLKGGAIELGECTQQWNFLYSEDLIRGLLSLAFYEGTIEGDGIYNIAGTTKETRPLREYVELLHRMCESRGTYTYGIREPNAEGSVNLMPDTKKLESLTGWQPEISFEEGIRSMINPKRCIACGSPLEGGSLMTLSDMPASAQDIPGAAQLQEDKGITLNLCQCGHCGLVQFDCGPVWYYRDVIRSGGFSTTMVELRSRQYQHFIETCGLQGKKIIEAGCGQGEFLSVLGRFPVDGYGVEHKKELVEIAVGQGMKVWEGFAEEETTRLESSVGQPPYDAFLSFNFLEHQPEPVKMLQCLYNNLTEHGVGLITVPSLEYILEHDGYYELIRDHIAYYTFETLRFVVEASGFEVLEEEMINRDTLSVIVRKRQVPQVPIPAYKPVDVSGLEASFSVIDREVNQLIDQLHSQKRTMAVWGASHQGFTLAATTRLGDKVSYMMDSAPFKQGRFAPVSHIPIVSPDYYFKEPVDAVLIVAPGYTDEIAGIIRERFGQQVQILTLRSSHIEEIS